MLQASLPLTVRSLEYGQLSTAAPWRRPAIRAVNDRGLDPASSASQGIGPHPCRSVGGIAVYARHRRRAGQHLLRRVVSLIALLPRPNAASCCRPRPNRGPAMPSSRALFTASAINSSSVMSSNAPASPTSRRRSMIRPRTRAAIGPGLAAAPANLPTRPATAPPPLTIEALPENVFPLRCYSKFFHSRRDDDSVW